MEKDSKRDINMNGLGIRVLRFSDIDVLNNIEGVIEVIMENIDNSENPP